MRSLYLRCWAFLLIGALALSPGAVLAQELSPSARAAIINGASAGAGLISVSSVDATLVAAPDLDEPEVDEPEVDEPEVDAPEVDAPEVNEPTTDEPEVTEPEVDEPEVDAPETDEPLEEEVDEDEEGTPTPVSPAVELAEYENAGLTIAAPADWDVAAMTMFDNLFTMEVPGTEFVGLIQGGEALDFPGVLAVIIMRTMPEFIVEQFGEDALLIGTETFMTGQNLPVVKVEFEADLEGTDTTGAFYVISPGVTAYIMIALAPPEQWAELQDQADAVAASIEFEPDLISLEGPAEEPLFVVDTEETLEIVLPELWLAAATGDPELPILTVSPGYEFVGALTATRDLADDVVLLLDETLVDGEIDAEIVDLVMNLTGEAMALEQDMIDLDPALSEVFVVRDELVLRMIGTIEIDIDVEMPVAIYVGLRRDGLSALIVFGDIDEAMALEDTLIDLLDSLLFIR